MSHIEPRCIDGPCRNLMWKLRRHRPKRNVGGFLFASFAALHARALAKHRKHHRPLAGAQSDAV